MKKILFCLVALTSMALYSCGKDDDSNLADKFVGEYDVTAEATLHNIPMMGDYSQTLDNLTCTIAKDGEEGDVILTMADRSTTGYVDKKGLHVESMVITETLMGANVDITVTFPVISEPVNGTIHWVSPISASVMGVSISGEADVTAIKK